MHLNTSAQNHMLSMLLSTAKCSFVRITEHKNKQKNRYQLGDEGLSALASALDDLENTDFIAEHNVEFENYQFSITLLSEYHAHIECALLKDINAVNDPNDRRHSAALNYLPTRLDVELVNDLGLPKHIILLGSSNSAELTNTSQSNTLNDNTWLSSLVLKTLCVTFENLKLIENYAHLTSDHLTKLKSRTALQRGIDEQILHSGMALCMIHCIDFQNVNRKFGQAQGDNVLHEIAGIIDEYTRSDDISGRFGGALFGIAIHASSVQDGYDLATKLQTAMHNKTYLQNAIRLSFNVGVAYVSQEEDQLDNSPASSLLINRSEQALKAAQNSSNPTIVQWEADKFRLDEQEFNYLGGIFTPDNITNYRNMLLLWDISSIIADEHTFARLLKSVIERLAFTFEFINAGIVSTIESDKHKEEHKVDSPNEQESFVYELSNATDINEIEFSSFEYREVITHAAKVANENSQHTEHHENGLNSLVIPLGSNTKDCFFIVGDYELLDLTHDTIMLFVGFARQLGKALKRSQLEDELNKNLEQQNARLAQELLDLKAGMQSSALVYRSEVMQKVVEQTQRAAKTDATVLITGESGTGKEKLINAIHNLSPRSDKPLVIVDCGSIPETLIESELFGHVKGAFTGAQSENKGKIEAANGGILVLDEIGELPLSMQPKLLRFVQEKHFTPVGSYKSQLVDVKIVAVTNRNLSSEVSQGRFRKDLFYRLNVVSLHNPPLRERIEDLELLCQHFLSKFSRQFEMDKKILSKHTISQMKGYQWPGNIRELENKLMQASLLTSSNEISYQDLQLDNIEDLTEVEHDIENRQTSVVHQAQSFRSTSTNIAPASHLAYHENEHTTSNLKTRSDLINTEQRLLLTPTQWCNQFTDTLDELLATLDKRTMISVSIGNALELVLLNRAFDKCGSHAKTALLLQMPISTARRRLLKPLPNLVAVEHNTSWQALLVLLDHIIKAQLVLTAPVDILRELIAQSILKVHSQNMGLASQLMGVSEPTMYKIRKTLKNEAYLN